MSELLIRAMNVSRTYGSGSSEVHALRDVSLEVPRGKFIAFKGRSGSGKTTLLNLLGGLDTPTTGEIWFDGVCLNYLTQEEITNWRREKVGFVFQSFALVPTFSAIENVEVPLRLMRIGPSEVVLRATQALKLVGMAKRTESRPDELSGGQQQRVAIARALVSNPELILADEPTGELDTENTRQMLGVFRKIVDQKGITVVMTSHNPLVEEFADEIFDLSDGKLRDVKGINNTQS